MCAVSAIYRDLLDGVLQPGEAHARLSGLSLPGALIDGYTRGAPGCAPVAAA
jgi:hypothetical protein